jgi:hypothetical protein
VAWGYNNSGQTNVPAGLANVTAVAAGIYHSIALKADGTITAWGGNSDGQTNVPAGLSNVVAISSGEFHSLALKRDGTVAAWGYNNMGQTNVPSGLMNVVAIACGDYFNLALKYDGSVVSWGDDTYGQTNLLLGLTNVVQLVGGMFHGYAIGNIAPQAASQTANGYVNHELTIALNGSPGDGPLLNYRVVAAPLTGALFQYTNGGRGGVINLASPAVADTGGRVIFVAATNSTGSPYDGFNFVANDGLNDSAPAAVTVNVGFPAAPQTQMSSWSIGGGGNFTLGFLGSSNAMYSIWGSTDLATWSWLGAAVEGTPGIYQFTDTTVSNWPARFYKVTAP